MESTRTELSDKVVWRNNKGQLHREDGPAIEWTDGTKFWFLNGKRHREDGPARECTNGVNKWYLNGLEYNEQDYNDKIMNIRLQRLMEL